VKHGYGAKEDEPSTGRVWAAGFHHVMARSCLVHVLKLTDHLFIKFSNFFSGCSKPRILIQWIRDMTVFHNILEQNWRFILTCNLMFMMALFVPVDHRH
jgi:hypothetical protein